MSVEIILSRLEGVQDRGHGQWYARCPAHDDRSPSLSVKQSDNGAVLIHCFAGCAPSEVLAAVGMEFSDLYPEKLEPRKGQRPYWNPRDLLVVIRHEALVVACAAEQIANGKTVDLERVRLAANRILNTTGAANVT